MRLTTSTPVNVSAERAWQIIAEEFGDTSVWASSMSASHLDRDTVEVGATRVGQVGKRQVSERVTMINRERRVFAYEIVDPPGPIHQATNSWVILDTGNDRCEVDSEMRMELHPLAAPLGPLLKLGIQRQLASALEEFSHYAETGTPHQRKLDQS